MARTQRLVIEPTKTLVIDVAVTRTLARNEVKLLTQADDILLSYEGS